MVQLHEIYGWQMSAHRALALLRRTGQANRLRARHLLSVLDSGSKRRQQLKKALAEYGRPQKQPTPQPEPAQFKPLG